MIHGYTISTTDSQKVAAQLKAADCDKILRGNAKSERAQRWHARLSAMFPNLCGLSIPIRGSYLEDVVLPRPTIASSHRAPGNQPQSRVQTDPRRHRNASAHPDCRLKVRC